MQYLSEGDIDMNPQTQHSLLVEEIPRELRSDRALFQYFDTLYPGEWKNHVAIIYSQFNIYLIQTHSYNLFRLNYIFYTGKVHSATVVLNIPDLEKVAAKRKRAVRRLEKR